MISGLGKALQKKGHLVEIILPKYDCMQVDQVSNLRVCHNAAYLCFWYDLLLG